MSHNPHAKGTKLDKLTAFMILGFFVLCVVTVVGPVQALAKARDEVRAAHVRLLMASVLQLQTQDPQAFDGLVTRLTSAGDLRVMIGDGDCSGSHGKQCQEFATSDTCLNIRDYLNDTFLPELPVDPDIHRFSTSLPGYYLSIDHDQLEVGSCGVTTREVVLEHEL